jgi:hypothetical protein
MQDHSLKKLVDQNLATRFKFKVNNGFQFHDGSIPTFKKSGRVPDDYFKDWKE